MRGGQQLAERDEQIIRAYMAGERQEDLARQYGLTQGSISRIVRDCITANRVRGMRRTKAHPDAKIARNRMIVKRFLEGYTVTELAEMFGLCDSRISYLLKVHGGEKVTALRAIRRVEHARKLALANSSSPEVRAKISQTLMACASRGRPRMEFGSDEDRKFYAKARKYYGAAYARKLMGLAA